MNDEYYMRRALELAKLGMGHTSPNPMVGAVIVKDGRIIGEGYHERCGPLHAERSALVCFGVAASVVFQTFENVGMCIGIAPVVGITLPFFSYGGSSVLSMFMAMGLVSGVRYRPKPVKYRLY